MEDCASRNLDLLNVGPSLPDLGANSLLQQLKYFRRGVPKMVQMPSDYIEEPVRGAQSLYPEALDGYVAAMFILNAWALETFESRGKLSKQPSFPRQCLLVLTKKSLLDLDTYRIAHSISKGYDTIRVRVAQIFQVMAIPPFNSSLAYI